MRYSRTCKDRHKNRSFDGVCMDLHTFIYIWQIKAYFALCWAFIVGSMGYYLITLLCC